MRQKENAAESVHQAVWVEQVLQVLGLHVFLASLNACAVGAVQMGAYGVCRCECVLKAGRHVCVPSIMDNPGCLCKVAQTQGEHQGCLGMGQGHHPQLH